MNDLIPFTDAWWNQTMAKLPEIAMQTDGRFVEQLIAQAQAEGMGAPGVQFTQDQGDAAFGDFIDPKTAGKKPGQLSIEQMQMLQAGMHQPPKPYPAGAASPAHGSPLAQALRINTGITPAKSTQYEPHSLARILNGGV